MNPHEERDVNEAKIFVLQGGKSVKVKVREAQETYVVLCYHSDLDAALEDWPNAQVIGGDHESV